MPWPLSTPGKDPVPIVQEAGRAPGPVWTGAENLAPTGIRSPDRPSHSQSLYWLSYPAHFCTNIIPVIIYIYDFVFPFHIPVSWAQFKKLVRWMFKHSSDIIQINSVNTQQWYFVSMPISISDVFNFLQAPKQCSCYKYYGNLSFCDS
jgi:hypothetical protein